MRTKNNAQIRIVGITNNNTKDFRLEGVLVRDSNTLEKFVTKFVPKGTHIVTDGWAGYNFINSPNSGYAHLSYNNGTGNFGFGMEYISYIESI